MMARSSTAPAGKLSNLPLNLITEASLLVRQDDAPRRIEQEPMRDKQRGNTKGHARTDIFQIPIPAFRSNSESGSCDDTMFTSKSFSYPKPRSTAQPSNTIFTLKSFSYTKYHQGPLFQDYLACAAKIQVLLLPSPCHLCIWTFHRWSDSEAQENSSRPRLSADLRVCLIVEIRRFLYGPL